MSRVKTILEAPEGAEESNIEGTTYFVEIDDAGRSIVTTNTPSHVETLKHHGYKVLQEISLAAPAAQKGLIEIDELGRSGLMAALTDRGTTYPPDASRGDLESIAQAWNQSRRGRPRAVDAAPVAGEPDKEPALVKKADAGPDIDALSYDDLKGWLTAHGVAFPPSPKKADLIRMCKETLAAQKPAAA